MPPLVSVIIPIYNMESFLAETLQSVLASTYPHFEVILVDDGSTDKSVDIAQSFVDNDQRVHLFRQENAGPCRARNRAVKESKGKYIFPHDADDLLAPHFLSDAVAVLEAQPEVKLVCPTIEFIGARKGIWQLPTFDRHLLARRNHIAACALYRRTDFDRVGGYCEEMIAREDWDFWIAMLKDGGEVVRLPEVGYWYRVRSGSKRFRDRKRNAHVIQMLNRRHAAFFERELGGPLRRMRSWSRCINFFTHPFRYRKTKVAEDYPQLFSFVDQLPFNFEQLGEQIFKNRNAIRRIVVEGEAFVVKEFCLPHRFNRFVYRWFRATKAARSFRNAEWFRAAGVGSPEPIGFCDTGSTLFIGHCYYVCRQSMLRYNFRDLNDETPQLLEVLHAVGETAARMNDHGWWHKDFSGGNVLWDITSRGVAVELIDLNRLRIGTLSPERGVLNLAALRPPKSWRLPLVEGYAAVRNADVDVCLQVLNDYLDRLPDNETAVTP